MFKKILAIVIVLVMALGLLTVAASAVTAKPTASTVVVNGQNIAFDAYNIDGNNYFKLRDLAFVINGTSKQFEVAWDGASNAISLTSGTSYTPDGSELSGKGGGNKEASLTKSRIIQNGRDANFTAYNIAGNNYFKLRDIGQAFNFGVDWDGSRNTIVIDTNKNYTPEAVAPSVPSASSVKVGDIIKFGGYDWRVLDLVVATRCY